MAYQLTGVVIVTGAGSGIGRATAALAAARGATVVVADLSETAHDTVSQITEAGGAALAVVGDIGDEQVAIALIDQAASAGPIAGLVNNAGVMDLFSGAAATTTEVWDRCLRVNATAPFYLTRGVLPHMLAAGSGSIVNVASEAGLRGGAAGAAYTTSKHAVIGLSRNTAFVYAKQGVRCNVICPGGVETNIMSSIDPTQIDGAGLAALGPVHGAMPRSAQAEEIAALAVFLLSSDASNVNGAIIPADGGWSAG